MNLSAETEEKKEARRAYQREWARKKRAKEKQSIKAGKGALLKFPANREGQDLLKLVDQFDARIRQLEESFLARQEQISALAEKQLEHQAQAFEKELQQLRQNANPPVDQAVTDDVNTASIDIAEPKSKSVDKKIDKKNISIKALFIGLCVGLFVLLSTYLQWLVYVDRGYSDWLSGAFAACGELAIVSTAYFFGELTSNIHRIFLRFSLLAGVLIVSLTVANGAYKKMEYLRSTSLDSHRQQEKIALDKFEKESNLFLATKTHFEKSTADLKNQYDLRLKIARDRVDRAEKNRDILMGAKYSAVDRQKADAKLASEENYLKALLENPPAYPEKPTLIQPKKPDLPKWTDPVDELSVWLQVAMQLFIFLSGVGLTVCLSSVARSQK